MNAPSQNRSTKAGGFLLAVSIMASTIVGGLMGQASAGLLAGAALGIVICVVLWLVDRRR
jgi:hypothetical protein